MVPSYQREVEHSGSGEHDVERNQTAVSVAKHSFSDTPVDSTAEDYSPALSDRRRDHIDMPPDDPKPDLHVEQEEAAAAASAVATAAATTEGLAAAAAGAMEVPPSTSTPACKPTACTSCGDEFPTRSALFRHLQNPPEHCSATRQDAGEKVLLLLGYDCTPRDKSETASAGTLQGPPAATRAVAGGDSAAGLVLKALGVGGAEDPLARPAGFSQASSVGSRSCPLLVQEAGVSAT